MEAKKIATIVLSVVLFALFVFFIVWTCLNWDTFKKTFDGTKLYTYDDVETAYDDGYSAGAKDKAQYELIITEYKEQIANLSTQRSELLTQITTLQNSNKDYSTELQNARTELAVLNNRIAYYEKLLEAYDAVGKFVATFVLDDEVYAVQLYDNESKLNITNPQNTDYMQFIGWTVNGEIINLETYTITEDTTFVASVVHKYAVQFVVQDVVYDSQIITEYRTATLPATPVVAGYDFDGWTLNGQIVTNINEISVTQHTTYVAKMTKLCNITFDINYSTLFADMINDSRYSFNDNEINSITNNNNTVINNNSNVTQLTIRADNNIPDIKPVYEKYEFVYGSSDLFYRSQTISNKEIKRALDGAIYYQYTFDYWTINGQRVDITNYALTGDVTIQAVYKCTAFLVLIEDLQASGYNYSTISDYYKNGGKIYSINSATPIKVA